MATGRSDFLWHSVVHLGAMSLTEGAPLFDHSVVERLRAILQDRPQFRQHPPVKYKKTDTNHRDRGTSMVQVSREEEC
jgi:hypothetical protein